MVEHGLIKVYESWSNELNLGINIGHNRVSDWIVEITAHGDRKNAIVLTQSNDLSLAMAEAEVNFKNWMRENNGGY